MFLLLGILMYYFLILKSEMVENENMIFSQYY